MTMATTRVRFTLPSERLATEPPEARGLRRDQVKLMVAHPGRVTHTRFDRLSEYLKAGDLLVVNSSPTTAAALPASMRGCQMAVHMASWHGADNWTVELRRPDNSGPILDAVANEVIRLEGGSIRLECPADQVEPGRVRLWRAHVELKGGAMRYMQRHGRPIRYGYVPQEWPLTAYQTVFADLCRWPGSAEMASAARPFTIEMVRTLRGGGVQIASIELHTGVSSQENHEPPQPERYSVPSATADAVNAARSGGGRVIAVGTTVTRALETVAGLDGSVKGGRGWTELVLGVDSPARAVDGLITGWHPPEASHLDLLEAVAGTELVAEAYEAAVTGEYLWHEFGDSCLLLPT